MRVDLREKDIDTLRAVFDRFSSVRSVRVFGSRATGSARRASDIDIAISAPDISEREWSELRDALDSAPLIYGLDVIRLENLTNEKLRERINSDGVEIYARP
jgi:proline iminopeptidase